MLLLGREKYLIRRILGILLTKDNFFDKIKTKMTKKNKFFQNQKAQKRKFSNKKSNWAHLAFF
jgi:hypothetical protein